MQNVPMKYALISSLFIAGSAVASLEWGSTEKTLVVHPSQVSSKAAFSFTNTGKQPISIKDIRVSCGCLSQKIAKRTYASGESGILEITFDLRNRTGKQRKATVVKTSEGRETKLYVSCDIPASYTIEPPIVRWGKKESVSEKIIHLANSGSTPVRLTSITSSNPEIPARLISIREGFEYDVILEKTGQVSTRSVIRIATAPPPGQTESKTLKLYAHVQ
jgi:hypothetical protein